MKKWNRRQFRFFFAHFLFFFFFFWFHWEFVSKNRDGQNSEKYKRYLKLKEFFPSFRRKVIFLLSAHLIFMSPNWCCHASRNLEVSPSKWQISNISPFLKTLDTSGVFIHIQWTRLMCSIDIIPTCCKQTRKKLRKLQKIFCCWQKKSEVLKWGKCANYTCCWFLKKILFSHFISCFHVCSYFASFQFPSSEETFIYFNLIILRGKLDNFHQMKLIFHHFIYNICYFSSFSQTSVSLRFQVLMFKCILTWKTLFSFFWDLFHLVTQQANANEQRWTMLRSRNFISFSFSVSSGLTVFRSKNSRKNFPQISALFANQTIANNEHNPIVIKDTQSFLWNARLVWLVLWLNACEISEKEL